jgi:hypothetical protein
MRVYKCVFAAAVCTILGATSITAQNSPDKTEANSPRWYNPARYNPLKWLKRGSKSADDQLASDGDLESKLSTQLRAQGILPKGKDLQDACSAFQELAVCVAVLRLSHSLPVEFTCLKWDVTGVKPKPVADSCAGPAGGKAMRLDRAVDLLKPDANARVEAREALKKAHDDIKDASS